MAGNLTLMMIKPSAVQLGYIGPILMRINESGFRIVAMKYLHLTRLQAFEFYKIHKEQNFFETLIQNMTAGPIVACILEKENAVTEFRKLIGSTDPSKAEEGTLRKLYGISLQKNGIHGSDSDENAIIESNFYFSQIERF